MDLLSVSTQHLCFSLFAAKDSRNDWGAKIDYMRRGIQCSFFRYIFDHFHELPEWKVR